QVRPGACLVEIGERGVPADGAADVDVVDDRVGAGRGGERRVPRRQLLRGEAADTELRLGAPQVRLELAVAPAGAPLVVGGRAREDDARVVGRAAAEDPGAKLRAVVAV